MSRRTYLDSGVLLAAFRADGVLGERAMQVLDDPDRQLLVSDAVWLEVMPKALYQGQQAEADFYAAVFEAAQRLAWIPASLARAAQVAAQHGIAAMDAIHIAHALDAQADEFITSEKPSKPMFRVQEGMVLTSLVAESERQGSP
ncbi:MAG: PIN domain-containing protein [Pseudomonadota bacterium]|nr:PIN domain-containing protein [Pseudomonadota bacterium]